MEKYFPYTVILASGLFRLIPHISNFSPVYGAVNLGFSSIKNGLLSTLAIIFILYTSDVLLALSNGDNLYPFYGWWLLYVYPVHILNGLMSKLIIDKPNKVVNIGVTCCLTSFNFFMMSNFGYFIFAQSDHSVQGLTKVYRDAVPFFPMQILSNFFFSTLFFGAYTLLFTRQQSVKVDPELGHSEGLINSSEVSSH